MSIAFNDESQLFPPCRKNMEQLGLFIFGQPGKLIVELSVIGFLMGTCVAFFVVIGDLSPLIVSKIFNLQHYDHDSVRKFLIILITVTTIVPLSLQKSIESLAFVCKASIGFYLCLTLKIVAESLTTFESDEHWTTNLQLWQPSGIIQCIPIFSMAMSCQMQLFEVYEPGSFDMIRRTVNTATFICCAVYCVIGFFGYIAFSGETLSGNVLMNLRPSFVNDAITFGFILSIACSFPLVIFPCRHAIGSFLHRTHLSSEFSSYVPESKYHPITFFIIFSTMLLGIMTPSVEVIISLVGSTIGIVVCVIFPATCFVKIMKRDSIEKRVAQAMIIGGFLIMILGTYSNLSAFGNSNSGAHLENRIIDKLMEHPRDIGRLKEEPVKEELEALKPPEVKVVDVKLSDDVIKKDEQEILAEKKSDLKEVQKELQEKNEEIQELMESKDHLERKMEIVMQKFEEIADKVDKIEKKAADDNNVVGKSLPKKSPNSSMELDNELKNLVKDIKLAENDVKDKVAEKKLEIPIEIAKLPEVKANNLTITMKNSSNIPAEPQKAAIDPIVQMMRNIEPQPAAERIANNDVKSNLTAIPAQPAPVNKDIKPAIDEETKNEMRRKRDLKNVNEKLNTSKVQSPAKRDLRSIRTET